MKKTAFVLVLIAMDSISLSAQEILVNSFEERPFYELSGSEIQKDVNGSLCALVNVYFEEKNASFEGSYVVGSTTIGRSYQVYLAGGASKMVVKHKDFLPLSIIFSDYGINKLVSNKAYDLNLIVDRSNYATNKKVDGEDFISKANTGDAEAQYKLGRSFYLGLNEDPDYNKAISWFKQSAEQGNIEATYNLGLCYYNGQGVEQNYDTAISYFKKAAEKGHAMAQFKYAICLHNGFGNQGKNIDEAIKWYESAASQDIIMAKNNVAGIYLFYDPTNYTIGTSDVNEVGFPQFYDKGLKYLKECEAAGIGESYIYLGHVYFNGIGVSNDGQKAFEYYKRAIDNGYYLGYNDIARCYSRGIGVKQNDKKAFDYFKMAAQKGLAAGCYGVALSYQFGRGTKHEAGCNLLSKSSRSEFCSSGE